MKTPEPLIKPKEPESPKGALKLLGSIGRIWALLSAIFWTLGGLAMIGCGIWILKYQSSKNAVQGTISAINSSPSGTCQAVSNGRRIEFNCSLTINYSIQNQAKTFTTNYTGATGYTVGSAITIYLDSSNNPDTASTTAPISDTTGWILVALGPVVIIGYWLWYWFVKRNETVAQLSGGLDLINFAR